MQQTESFLTHQEQNGIIANNNLITKALLTDYQEIMKKPQTYTYEETLAASAEYFNETQTDDKLVAGTFINKYAMRDKDGALVDKTPADMHARMASEFARIEKNKFKNPLSYEEIFAYFDHFKWIVPQGSPMTGIGNRLQFTTLSNCYVVPSPADSYGGIMMADQHLVQISKRRGGVGMDLSKLRPSGVATTNAARSSTGVVSFMKRFSNSIREVGQNGRRGALMLSISIHHPESVVLLADGVEPKEVVIPENKEEGMREIHTTTEYYNPDVPDFASIKYDRKLVTGANVSIRLTDEFLQAVAKGEKFEQRWPVDSKKPVISKMVDARRVWKKIIRSAWEMGEPGLLFWDNILRESPADCYADKGYETISTNPCVLPGTWTLTSDGPKQVKDLIGKQFDAIVNGVNHSSTTDGFFFSGKKDVLHIKTSEGYSIDCTGNHPLQKVKQITRKDCQSDWVEAGTLKVGDKILLSNHRNSAIQWDGPGTCEEGWLIGNLVGDGVFTENNARLDYWGKNKEEMHELASGMIRENLPCRSDLGSGTNNSVACLEYDKKTVKSSALKNLAFEFGVTADKNCSDQIEMTSSEFHRGFLRGWYDADGSVFNDENKKSFAIRLSSINLENLQRAQRMLSRMGIVSTLYLNRRPAGTRELPDGKGGSKNYSCQAIHELHIGGDNIVVFERLIGFNDSSKQSKLKSIIRNYKRGPYRERFVSTISGVESMGEHDVYDCSIPSALEFDANGIRAHNCAEIPLSAFDSCRLIAMNLLSYVDDPFTDKAAFNYDKFYKHAQVTQRLGDDLVDLEEESIRRIIGKIEADPEDADAKEVELNLWKKILRACTDGRRTGNGVTAVGDVLAALNIKYGSDDSIKEVDKIYRTLKLGCYRSSVDMAKELGAFPLWDHEKEKNNPFLLRMKDEDPEMYADMKKFGRRNIALLTTAPTGTVSFMTQTTNGIEPLAKLKPYVRRKKINPNDEGVRVDEVDQNGDSWQRFDVIHFVIAEWMKVTGETDIQKSPWAGCCAEDLDWNKRVEIQATANRHVDHAISSTVNLPKDISEEKVASVYETAWKLGCKGITVYRKDCRRSVITDKEGCPDCKDANKALQEAVGSRPENLMTSSAPKRPPILKCDIYRMTVNGEEWLFFVGLWPKTDAPFEIFGGSPKGFKIPKKFTSGWIEKDGIKDGRTSYDLILGDLENEDEKLVFENIAKRFEKYDKGTFTRCISLILRHGIPIKHLNDQLTKDPEDDLFSFSKAIARVLKKYIGEGEKSGLHCSNCGSDDVVYRNGCPSCNSCKHSQCS